MKIRNMVLYRNLLVVPEDDFQELFDRMLQVKRGQKKDDEQSGINH